MVFSVSWIDRRTGRLLSHHRRRPSVLDDAAATWRPDRHASTFGSRNWNHSSDFAFNKELKWMKKRKGRNTSTNLWRLAEGSWFDGGQEVGSFGGLRTQSKLSLEVFWLWQKWKWRYFIHFAKDWEQYHPMTCDDTYENKYMLKGSHVFEWCKVRTNVKYRRVSFSIWKCVDLCWVLKKILEDKILHDYKDKWLNWESAMMNHVTHLVSLCFFFFIFGLLLYH